MNRKRMRQVFGTIALMGILVISGCGASTMATESAAVDTAAGAYETNEIYSEDSMGETDAGATADSVNESAESTNRKLIRTVDMNVETEEYDTLLSNVEAKVDELGGYIESRTDQRESYYSTGGYRYSNLTLRIPADKLDEFLSEMAEKSNITYQTENVEDVTLNYVDLESHRNALKEEEKRLLELMAQAENVQDLITIENSLADVRYQIESMESQIRVYDNQVDYSTVTVNISEVSNYSPGEETPVSERIKAGFVARVKAIGAGFKNIGIWLVIHIPDLIVVAVIVFVIVGIVKLCTRRKKNRKEPKKNAGNFQSQNPRQMPEQLQEEKTQNNNNMK